jgi:hypothetical protein
VKLINKHKELIQKNKQIAEHLKEYKKEIGFYELENEIRKMQEDLIFEIELHEPYFIFDDNELPCEFYSKCGNRLYSICKGEKDYDFFENVICVEDDNGIVKLYNYPTTYQI